MTKKSNNETGFSLINTGILKNKRKKGKTQLQYSVHIAITEEMKDFLVLQEKNGKDKGEFIRELLKKEIELAKDKVEDVERLFGFTSIFGSHRIITGLSQEKDDLLPEYEREKGL